MALKHLSGTAPIETPEPALAMYEAEPKLAMARWPARVHWSDDLGDALLRQFRDLKDTWKFDPEPDRQWNRPAPFKTDAGWIGWEGNCNDFAPQLLTRWLALDIPRGALRLLICEIGAIEPKRAHMVLALDTTRGTLIACNLWGVFDHGNAGWKDYDWLCWEGHRPGPDGWESLSRVGLDAAIEAAGN